MTKSSDEPFKRAAALKERRYMKKLKAVWSMTLIIAVVTFYFAAIQKNVVSANNTPQTLPFSQNWSNIGLITIVDDWSGVPGVIGYRGDDLTVATGTDPRTILADGSATPVDVNSNQLNPDTFATGGVTEFEIANAVVALQGSGTADAPHLVFHLNTTGLSNIQFACNVRDIDGSADNAIQQVDVQFRVGATGSYASVTGGYIADATTAASATQVTPLSLTLPAAANNQAILEIRVITTNAVGNDESVGIDDVNITAGAAPAPQQNIVDFNGDGRTDFAVVRDVGASGSGATNQFRWFVNFNGTATNETFDWGIATDTFVPVDFDGDNRSDFAVWRAVSFGQPSGNAFFFIFASQTNTVRIVDFGQIGDDPTVVGDYDGDGAADVAVYRPGFGQPSTWFYLGSINNPPSSLFTAVQWGQIGDVPAPGDYNGDGRNDFVIQRDAGGGQAVFWTLLSNGGISITFFGGPADQIVPGDYDGDGRTDIAILRNLDGQIGWFHLPSSGGPLVITAFGLSNGDDFPVPGDYDGDGRTDQAIWRFDATQNNNFFINRSGGGISTFAWGQQGDLPVALYNVHAAGF